MAVYVWRTEVDPPCFGVVVAKSLRDLYWSIDEYTDPTDVLILEIKHGALMDVHLETSEKVRLSEYEDVETYPSEEDESEDGTTFIWQKLVSINSTSLDDVELVPAPLADERYQQEEEDIF